MESNCVYKTCMMYKPFISENIKTIWISYLLSNVAYTKYMLSYIYSCSKNNNNVLLNTVNNSIRLNLCR